MYPDKTNPAFGIFVKRSVDILVENGNEVKLVVMYKKRGKIKKVLSYIMHYFSVIKEVIRADYDIVYVHFASLNAIPVLIAQTFKQKIKIITNVHGGDVVPEKGIAHLFQPFVKRLLHVSDKVIVPSDYFKELVQSKYALKNDIHISPSGGIDPTVFFVESPDYSTFDLSEQYKYVGYVGRIDYGKGWDIFLEAISLVKQEVQREDIKYIIVGNGSQYQQLQSDIESKNLLNDIILIDLLSQDKLQKLYNVIDVLIFPTTRQGESLGLVGLEAMACGTPTIGSRIGGLKSYIEDGVNGFLFEPGNAVELKQKLVYYYNLSENEISEIEENALRTIDKFSRNYVKNQFKDIFNIS